MYEVNAPSEIEMVYTYDQWLRVYEEKEKKQKNALFNGIFRQKLMGVALLLVTAAIILLFPDDMGAAVFTGPLGIVLMLYNKEIKN